MADESTRILELDRCCDCPSCAIDWVCEKTGVKVENYGCPIPAWCPRESLWRTDPRIVELGAHDPTVRRGIQCSDQIANGPHSSIVDVRMLPYVSATADVILQLAGLKAQHLRTIVELEESRNAVGKDPKALDNAMSVRFANLPARSMHEFDLEYLLHILDGAFVPQLLPPTSARCSDWGTGLFLFDSVDGWQVVCRYINEEIHGLEFLIGPDFRVDAYQEPETDIPEDRLYNGIAWTMHETFLRSWRGNGDVARLVKTLKPGETLSKAWKCSSVKDKA